MNNSYNICGIIIPVVTSEKCDRLAQYGKNLEITCACSRCIVQNAGMTSAQIRARMDKAHGKH